MNHPALPAAVLLFVAVAAPAETLRVPGLSPDEQDASPAAPECTTVQGETFCARVLACIGGDGLWFDGQARGWNSGELFGERSDGVACTGTWAYGGIFNTAQVRMQCGDGLTARLIYTAQDSLTGTGIAHGYDSSGRWIRAWSGENVLRYLGKTEDFPAALPCASEPIPIS